MRHKLNGEYRYVDIKIFKDNRGKLNPTVEVKYAYLVSTTKTKLLSPIKTGTLIITTTSSTTLTETHLKEPK